MLINKKTYSPEMTTVRCVPIIGLGTSQIKEQELVEKVLLEAIRTGYRHIDTAVIYNNEKEIGDALQVAFKNKMVEREDMFIVTKLPWFAHHPDQVKASLQKSLARMQLSYIDLYLIHEPVAIKGSEENPWLKDERGKIITDDNVNLVDTWSAMEKLVDEGLVKGIGLSNFNSEQIKTIYNAARIKPMNLQVECHPYLQQRRLFNLCQSLGISFTAYAPLGSSGRKNSEVNLIKSRSVLQDQLINGLAKRYNKTAAQICLRWLIQRGIIVIPKSINLKRIKENFQIFDFQLTEDDMANINKLDKNHRLFKLELPGLKEDPRYPFTIPY